MFRTDTLVLPTACFDISSRFQLPAQRLGQKGRRAEGR